MQGLFIYCSLPAETLEVAGARWRQSYAMSSSMTVAHHPPARVSGQVLPLPNKLIHHHLPVAASLATSQPSPYLQ
jgi:hypothetical protein